MLSVFCYNMLVCICYITLLYMLINKFTTGSFENGSSVQKKKMAYTILCVLQASYTINNDQQHIITKEFYSKQLKKPKQ